MISIYVLKCKDNKYYIGKSMKLDNSRIIDHFIGEGSVWTKKYPPIEVVEIINNVDNFAEDLYTKKYMLKYGIDNVRGGSYITITLPSYQLQSLKKEICTVDNTCFKCHREGHFAKDCNVKTTTEKKQDNVCYRCHRRGHFGKDCYAKTYITGEKIQNKTCFRCHREGHFAKNCYAKTYLTGEFIESDSDSENNEYSLSYTKDYNSNHYCEINYHNENKIQKDDDLYIKNIIVNENINTFQKPSQDKENKENKENKKSNSICIIS